MRRARRISSARCGWSDVAPRDPVVRVAVLDERARPSPAAASAAGDDAVVVEVLLAGAAGERDRDARRRRRVPPATVETKRVIRAKRPKPDSCASSARRKKLPDWRKRPPNEPRAGPVRVQEPRARRGSRRCRSAGRAKGAASRSARHQLLGERARVAGRRGVASRCGRAAAGSSAARNGGSSPKATRWSSRRSSVGVPRVLGAVVDEQQRQRLARDRCPPPTRAARRPTSAARASASVSSRSSPGRRLVVGDPLRRLVAGELDHRLLAERPGRPQRVRRVGHALDAPVAVLELEQVLEPVDRRAASSRSSQRRPRRSERHERAAAAARARARRARTGRRRARDPPSPRKQRFGLSPGSSPGATIASRHASPSALWRTQSVTRRATSVTRNTWPSSASSTVSACGSPTDGREVAEARASSARRS